MDFMTVDRRIQNGMCLLLYCCEREKFNLELVGDRFRIIFIENGTGVLGIDKNKMLFNAPAVFCLNETEEISLAESSSVSAFSVYFNPAVINSALNFENLRSGRSGMTATERNDCTCLGPFFERSDSYHGQISVGITMFKSMKQLFQELKNELTGQYDYFWPCRSRSYLIEILFMLQRIYLSPAAGSEIILNNNSELVGQVMLYLHTNYEKRITVDDLSRHLNMNRTTLNERFRKETGMTAIAYLIDLRIRLACMMLRDTMIPVSEIAGRVGFNDTAHFTRTFSKLMRHSPSDYRQSNNWLLK